MKTTIGILLLMFPFVINGQIKLKKMTIKNSEFGIVETFKVLKTDQSIRHGEYIRKRKGQLLAKGTYNFGQKETFQYFDSDGSILLEYNYQEHKIINYKEPNNYDHYLDLKTKTQADRIPLPLFSPDELRIFIAMNVRYPLEAMESGVSGRPKIAIKINKTGQVIDCVIFESSHKALDDESLRVLKKLPKTWNFVPAMKDGKPTESFVIVPVNFIIA
ncbi:energy transducer TonB [Carboxylicivirga mesophila]|uniref:Energy transducer TonB n=1 Tax=Carboxylicivirga mesophila TaxID=1166478 RepID=A0ABS5K483_9BACT|nr:energy transducer TonB [Carboxylicivirga mesophila]MBS2209833.1 energy transducer TonB [Carboxylicivirga mesophila]